MKSVRGEGTRFNLQNLRHNAPLSFWFLKKRRFFEPRRVCVQFSEDFAPRSPGLALNSQQEMEREAPALHSQQVGCSVRSVVWEPCCQKTESGAGFPPSEPD